jgi:hypothetical protein
MNHTQNLPFSKDLFFKAKNHKINFLSNHAKIDSSNNELCSMNKQEAMSVSKAKEVVLKNLLAPKEAMQILANLEVLKEAHVIFSYRNGIKELPNNIATVPTFFESQIDRVELSDQTKETFARIGERARKEFIEEQIVRADQYNIPYNAYTVNFLELSYKIDEYEELLSRAKGYSIDWDTSEYDPVALRQEIDEQEHSSSLERNDLYTYFRSTRGLEV